MRLTDEFGGQCDAQLPELHTVGSWHGVHEGRGTTHIVRGRHLGTIAKRPQVNHGQLESVQEPDARNRTSCQGAYVAAFEPTLHGPTGPALDPSGSASPRQRHGQIATSPLHFASSTLTLTLPRSLISATGQLGPIQLRPHSASRLLFTLRLWTTTWEYKCNPGLQLSPTAAAAIVTAQLDWMIDHRPWGSRIGL